MANPAAITTYALLKNAIEDHLNRTDVDDEGVSALCIQLAEAEFDRRVEHHRRRSRATASVSTQYLDLPDDWHSPITVRLLTSGFIGDLEIVSPGALMTIRAKGGEAAGRPTYVTTVGDALEFFPTPNDTYTVEMHYLARIAKLSDSNTTNWLLDSYPDVYLYGSLFQAEIYYHDDERAARWRSVLEQSYTDMRKEFNRSYGPVSQRWPSFGARARRR